MSNTVLKPLTKTGILVTVGPSLRYNGADGVDPMDIGKVNLPELRQMMIEGARHFRLNFSHANKNNSDPNHQSEKEFASSIREIAEELDIAKDVTILGDLQGPKHRSGAGDVSFKAGDTLIMHSNLDRSYTDESGIIHVHFENTDVYPSLQGLNEATNEAGDTILLKDGESAVRVLRTYQDELGWHAVTAVIYGSQLLANQGINFPGRELNIDTMTAKDINDLRAMIEIGVDKIALSFVQRGEDILRLKSLIDDMKNEMLEQGKNIDPDYNPKIVAKIEKPQAIVNIEAITKLVDEIMFARGDMGVEIPAEWLPTAKDFIHAAARKHGAKFIMATQVAPSLQFKAQPTRSEVCAINTYVKENADFIMFSEETAMTVRPLKPSNVVAQVRVNIAQAELLRDNPTQCRKDLIRILTPGFNETGRAGVEKTLMSLLVGHIETANDNNGDAQNTFTPATSKNGQGMPPKNRFRSAIAGWGRDINHD